MESFEPPDTSALEEQLVGFIRSLLKKKAKDEHVIALFSAHEIKVSQRWIKQKIRSVRSRQTTSSDARNESKAPRSRPRKEEITPKPPSKRSEGDGF